VHGREGDFSSSREREREREIGTEPKMQSILNEIFWLVKVSIIITQTQTPASNLFMLFISYFQRQNINETVVVALFWCHIATWKLR